MLLLLCSFFDGRSIDMVNHCNSMKKKETNSGKKKAAFDIVLGFSLWDRLIGILNTVIISTIKNPKDTIKHPKSSSQ